MLLDSDLSKTIYKLQRGHWDAYSDKLPSLKYLSDHQLGKPHLFQLQETSTPLQSASYQKRLLETTETHLSILHDESHSIILTYCTNGLETSINYGIKLFNFSKLKKADPTYYPSLFKNSFVTNYPGYKLSNEISSNVAANFGRKFINCDNVSILLGSPSLKSEKVEQLLMLDGLTSALRGRDYSMLIVAEPMSRADIEELLKNCHLQMSVFHQNVLQNEANAKGENVGQQKHSSSSKSASLSLGLGLGLGTNTSRETSFSEQNTVLQTKTVTTEWLNPEAKHGFSLFNTHAEQFKQGLSTGMWQLGIFLAADDHETFILAERVLMGMLKGEQTFLEPFQPIHLKEGGLVIDNGQPALGLIEKFTIPALDLTGVDAHPLGENFHSLATIVTTQQASLLFSPPEYEIHNIEHRPVVDFSINSQQKPDFTIGNIIYRKEKLDYRFGLTINSLKRGAGLFGLPGLGKTNICLQLLINLYQTSKIPFIVIDPAKHEWRFLLNNPTLASELWIFTADPLTSPLKINPLHPVEGFPLSTHIELLTSIISSCFVLLPPLPQLLTQVIQEVYTSRGWDLATSKNIYVKEGDDPTPFIPTLGDMLPIIENLVKKKGYSDKTQVDIEAALKLRFEDLKAGIKGSLLNTRYNSVPYQELFTRPVVVELWRLASDEIRAFFMAMLFMLIYEYCKVQGSSSNQLRHVVLIEESHRILGRKQSSRSAYEADPESKTSQIFSSMLAELREFGESFFIIDQHPENISKDVIKNTNLKVVYGLQSLEDRTAIANTMGLTNDQRDYLVYLRPGEAVVQSNEIGTAVLVQFDLLKDYGSNKAIVTDKQINTHMELFYTQFPQLKFVPLIPQTHSCNINYMLKLLSQSVSVRGEAAKLIGSLVRKHLKPCQQLANQFEALIERTNEPLDKLQALVIKFFQFTHLPPHDLATFSLFIKICIVLRLRKYHTHKLTLSNITRYQQALDLLNVYSNS